MGTFFEGERIKLFPDTDTKSYERWIRSEGYECEIKGEYIIVLTRVNRKYSSVLLGELIRKKRKIKGISREGLANMLLVNKETVFGWEIGRTLPNKYNMNNLIDCLDLSERDLDKCVI